MRTGPRLWSTVQTYSAENKHPVYVCTMWTLVAMQIQEPRIYCYTSSGSAPVSCMADELLVMYVCIKSVTG